MERWGAYYKLKCISGWFSFSATAYKINVFTSAGILGAGTDANVFIIICGNSQTPEIHLKKSETHKDPFEKGHEDIFTYESDRNLGRLQKVHIRHDNKGKFLRTNLGTVKVKASLCFENIQKHWLSSESYPPGFSQQLYKECCSNLIIFGCFNKSLGL